MEYGHFPSVSVCIIKYDKVVWSKGYGYSDMESNIQATDNTVYTLCSITKSITGTALMQLYDKGLFDLDDDVNNYLPFTLRNPNFPDIPITFRMLLSHSSSLRSPSSYWNIDFYLSGGPPFDGYPDPYLRDYLIPDGINYDPNVWDNDNEPGIKSVYANINFDIISYLIELISGTPFYGYCNENIFIPLDMKNTSFNLSYFSSDQLAFPYFWDPYSDVHVRNQNDVHIHYPAGGLFTTVMDLSHFMIAHINGGIYNQVRILKESTVEEMHKIQPPGNRYGFNFGLAWLITSRSIWFGMQYPNFPVYYFPNLIYSGHGGDITSGMHTRMYTRLSGDIAVIFFINTHRIHRSGWNGAELLTELLFLKADQL
jgi:CubicO group peptidase (beta-lactamase class C family)